MWIMLENNPASSVMLEEVAYVGYVLPRKVTDVSDELFRSVYYPTN